MEKYERCLNSHFILFYVVIPFVSIFLSPIIKFPSLTENKESVLLAKCVKEEKKGDSLEVLQQCKTTSLVASSTEQGSTLRDLLTTTAGKLKLGSTDAGIAFAPVYSTASQVCFCSDQTFCLEDNLVGYSALYGVVMHAMEFHIFVS